MEGRRRRAVGSLLGQRFCSAHLAQGPRWPRGLPTIPEPRRRRRRRPSTARTTLKTRRATPPRPPPPRAPPIPPTWRRPPWPPPTRRSARPGPRTPPRKTASLAERQRGHLLRRRQGGAARHAPDRERRVQERQHHVGLELARPPSATNRTATWPASRSCTTRTWATTSSSATARAASRSGRSRTRSCRPTSAPSPPPRSCSGADSHGPADTQARFYEGENPTVDSRRKLAFLARDPRSLRQRQPPERPHRPLHHRRQGSVGSRGPDATTGSRRATPRPASTTAATSGASARPTTARASPASRRTSPACCIPEWTGVPAFVTDVRDPMHPYTYAQPVDMKRNNNTTAYTHSVDVDQHGLAWTSGFGGVRGYYTNGLHHDPVLERRPLRDGDRPGPVRGRRRPVAGVGRRSTRRSASSTTPSTARRRPRTRRRRPSRRPAAGRSARPTCSTSRRRTSRAAPRPAAAAPAAS